MQETSYIPSAQTHLLSLSQCGCYLSTQDLIHLAHCVHSDVAYKKREELLRSIVLHVHNNGHEKLFKQALRHLLEHKEKHLVQCVQHTPKAAELLARQREALQATKLHFCTDAILH